MSKFNLEKQFNRFKSENLVKLGFPAIVVFLLNSIADFNLYKKDLHLFIFLRFLFISPYLIYVLTHKKIKSRYVDLIVFTIFLSASVGVACVSYVLGGITSDYYFGLIVLSFAQLAFVPLSLKLSIFLDLLFAVIFFTINFLPFDHPEALLVKQLTNYLSFSILKFLVVNRSRGLILTALKGTELERELGERTHVQMLLGELCHLLNNPLLISMTLIKKIKKNTKDDEGIQQSLDKALDANERMADVASRMLELYNRDEVNWEEQKKYLYEERDFKTIIQPSEKSK